MLAGDGIWNDIVIDIYDTQLSTLMVFFELGNENFK
jgi:hypothetical protein